MFETKILDGLNNRNESISEGVNFLKNGLPIAFPTETVYGLGAPLFDEPAVDAIYQIKQRPRSNPLAAHISRPEHVELLCRDIPKDFYKILDNFLPGAISIILPKNKSISDNVTGGLDTISIRYPDNELCLELIEALGQPLAATSANRSGMPSPNNAEQVLEDLNELIPVIIDGGKCKYSIESTVLSLAESEPVIFRPGVVTQAAIEQVLGKRVYSRDKQVTLYAPAIEKKSTNSGIPIRLFAHLKEINEYLDHNSEKKLLILSKFNRLLNENHEERILASDSFFDSIRYALRSKFEEVIILFDDLAKSDEALSHRIKTSVNG